MINKDFQERLHKAFERLPPEELDQFSIIIPHLTMLMGYLSAKHNITPKAWNDCLKLLVAVSREAGIE